MRFLIIALGLLAFALPAYAQLGPTENIKIDTGEETIPVDAQVDCPIQMDKPYKSTANNSVYYISLDCKKRPIKNEAVYFSYFSSWSEVGQTSPSTLASVGDHPLGFLPWGPKYAPIDGSLFKSVDDPRVFVVLKGKRYALGSEQTFNRLGFKWNWIEDVDIRLLDKLTFAGTLDEQSNHPDGMMLKYTDRSNLYVLENGRKRHVADQETWNKLQYRKDRFVELPSTFIYETGLQLKL